MVTRVIFPLPSRTKKVLAIGENARPFGLFTHIHLYKASAQPEWELNYPVQMHSTE
jgi:hypothetical protein